MKTFTVVGLYIDNKQVYVTSLDAKDAHAAAAAAKKGVSCEINVLSIFEGDHQDLYGEDELIED